MQKYKYVTGALWIGLALLAGVVGAKLMLARNASPDASGLEVLFAAPDFALTAEDGKEFSSKSLAGKPYVAAFTFTHCASTCPIVSARLSVLQKKIDPAVKFVSFSVDPLRDTPVVMSNYAAKYEADTTRWRFLTGKPADMDAVSTAFRVKLNMNGGEILHSDLLFLVDGQSRVRGMYSTQDNEAMARLANDAALVLKGGNS
jgi:protein SCO1